MTYSTPGTSPPVGHSTNGVSPPATYSTYGNSPPVGYSSGQLPQQVGQRNPQPQPIPSLIQEQARLSDTQSKADIAKWDAQSRAKQAEWDKQVQEQNARLDRQTAEAHARLRQQEAEYKAKAVQQEAKLAQDEALKRSANSSGNQSPSTQAISPGLNSGARAPSLLTQSPQVGLTANSTPAFANQPSASNQPVRSQEIGTRVQTQSPQKTFVYDCNNIVSASALGGHYSDNERSFLRQCQQGFAAQSARAAKWDRGLGVAENVATRLSGAGQAAGGALEVQVGAVACATGIGCAAGAPLALAGADNVVAGAKTALTGKPQGTVGGKVLDKVSPGNGELIYGVAQIPLAGVAALSNGRVVREIGSVATRFSEIPISRTNQVGNRAMPNQVPENLSNEIATAQRLNVKPTTIGTAEFDKVVNGGAMKYVVLENGSLILAPMEVKGVEISHAVLSGGKPVLSAGVVDIAGSKGTYLGASINAQSGHFLNGSTRAQTDEFEAIARKAFERFGVKFR